MRAVRRVGPRPTRRFISATERHPTGRGWSTSRRPGPRSQGRSGSLFPSQPMTGSADAMSRRPSRLRLRGIGSPPGPPSRGSWSVSRRRSWCLRHSPVGLGRRDRGLLHPISGSRSDHHRFVGGGRRCWPSHPVSPHPRARGFGAGLVLGCLTFVVWKGPALLEHAQQKSCVHSLSTA